jgi:hypothetical protein
MNGRIAAYVPAALRVQETDSLLRRDFNGSFATESANIGLTIEPNRYA